MLSGYRPSGGLIRSSALSRLLDDWHRGRCAGLAQLVATDEIFGFNWHAESWIPMFQFDGDLSVKPALSRVLTELKPMVDEWALAAWFIQPNPWLQTKQPVDLLDSDLPAVMDAARNGRSIAVGSKTA
jgi:hypothetical protein